MKTFFLAFIFILLCFVSYFFQSTNVYGACSWTEGVGVSTQFNNCMKGTDLVDTGGDMKIESGLKVKVTRWTNNIATLLGLLAIGGIVYGGFLMTLSAGEDEKIKKGKEVVKWSLIGFLALVSASSLVRIVVEFIFSLS